MMAEDTKRLVAFDGASESRIVECAHCHRQVRRVMRYITIDHSSTFGICFASLHEGKESKEGWLDVILGMFGEGGSNDHVTFGCRVTAASGSTGPMIVAVDAASAFAYQPVMGQRLTREQALSHARLGDFWAIVDLMVLLDPEVHGHLYGGT
jgi:hypothetical protein